MNEVLSIAASSMGFDTERLQSIANNLANVTTIGYKRDIVDKKAVAAVFDHHLQFAGMVAPQETAAVDMHPGALQSTGNPLDLAIEGGGFFEIKTADGVAYTRAGAFRLDRQGQLVNEGGNPVMGTGGPITLSTPIPVIDKLGRVFEKGTQVAQIKVVSFSNINQLNHIGQGLYDGTKAHAVQGQDANNLRQGFIEASNVSSMHEMVRMMETLRHFESMQKVVQGWDGAQDTVMRKLGEF
ncbi:MAG: flagellar basal-body rod protein FlgF [Pseudomonadota bacterium]